jgi:predicted GNAT family acetyltransferase
MVDVRLSEDASRFEAHTEGLVAGHILLRPRGGVIELDHTTVETGFEGRGIAGQLVRAAADHVRASGARLAAACSYAEAWLDKHPEYDDIRA